MTTSQQDNKILNVLDKIGLSAPTKLSSTLQGSVWRANGNNETNESFVIKVTNQLLHSQRVSIVNGKKYPVQEDILLEQAILKYLTDFTECPKSIVKHKRFFKSRSDYYLIMENGGTSLFDFILKAHIFIKRGVLALSNWQEIVKIIFSQMIEAIEFIHSKNICHFDISLENVLINNVKIAVQYDNNKQTEKIIMKTDGIQVKLIDFGLAQLFSSSECKSSKFCGKKSYKSPEINDQNKGFNAKQNDIFCMGVCLFMMITGCPPWIRAQLSDNGFKFIVAGYLKPLLDSWNILHYVNNDLVDLFEAIFQYESERIELKDIKTHLWLNNRRFD